MAMVQHAPGREPRVTSERSLFPVVIWACTGTVTASLLVLWHVRRTGNNVLNLLQPGAAGPSAGVIRRDFPSVTLPPGLGYDGQQFYAIARQPMHWNQLRSALDRPLYRLERPLYPWLGWALHPQGGGRGLVLALFVVGLLAMIGGGIAFGSVAQRAGRSPAFGVLFPLLPGSLIGLRTSTADLLAVSLALWALVADRRRRTLGAVLCAFAAVLTKEIVLAILIGNAIARRTRAAVVSAVIAGAGFTLFWLVAGAVLGTHSSGVVDTSWPVVGLVGALRRWSGGQDLFAAGAFAVLIVVVVMTGRATGLRHRELWALLVPGAYLLVLRADPLELNLGGPRTFLPLTAVCIFLFLAHGGQTPQNSSQLPALATDEALRL